MLQMGMDEKFLKLSKLFLVGGGGKQKQKVFSLDLGRMSPPENVSMWLQRNQS